MMLLGVATTKLYTLPSSRRRCTSMLSFSGSTSSNEVTYLISIQRFKFQLVLYQITFCDSRLPGIQRRDIEAFNLITLRTHLRWFDMRNHNRFIPSRWANANGPAKPDLFTSNLDWDFLHLLPT